jgi:G3E family GTPase
VTTRLILVGGFLGAGKTTLLLESARWLSRQGYRVGLVTNDQGEQLVDTTLAMDAEIPVTEVAGGCFCCRFPDLLQALQKLQDELKPDVILAEPVGSCTDLMATVLRPLSLYHGEQFTLAPLTVLLGADHDTASFSTQVAYLHEKQLAEAEYILLNKADLLSVEERTRQLQELRSEYANAQVQAISARHGDGIDSWLMRVLTSPSRLSQALELDYAMYAEAEAELGWLNARGTLQSESPFAPEEWVSRTLNKLNDQLSAQQAPVAHMKMHLHTAQGIFKASVTAPGALVSWDRRLPHVLTGQAEFLFNLRAAASPTLLEDAVRVILGDAGTDSQVRCGFTHFECFRPAPPKPTHRITLVA